MDLEQKRKEIQNMKRVWDIISHPSYQGNLQKNIEAEKDRIFCVHDMQHFIDVARLAYIFNLERNYEVDKDIIYAAAFLHDIGKWQQYQDGTPHEIASEVLAESILKDTGFTEEERKLIRDAIHFHRKGDGGSKLDEILYDADKLSRSCYACKAKELCNWTEEKKNLKVTW